MSFNEIRDFYKNSWLYRKQSNAYNATQKKNRKNLHWWELLSPCKFLNFIMKQNFFLFKQLQNMLSVSKGRFNA